MLFLGILSRCSRVQFSFWGNTYSGTPKVSIAVPVWGYLIWILNN